VTAGCWDRPPVASAHLGWASRGRILGDGRTSGLLRRTCAYLCLRARCPVGASDPALLDGQNGRRAVSRITDTVAAPGAQGLPGFVARTSAYRPTLRRGVFCRVGRAAGCRRSSGQSAGPLSSSRIVDESECGRGRVWRLTSWTASRGEQQRRALRTPGAALPGTPDSLVSEGAADGHPRPGAQGPNRFYHVDAGLQTSVAGRRGCAMPAVALQFSGAARPRGSTPGTLRLRFGSHDGTLPAPTSSAKASGEWARAGVPIDAAWRDLQAPRLFIPFGIPRRSAVRTCGV